MSNFISLEMMVMERKRVKVDDLGLELDFIYEGGKLVLVEFVHNPHLLLSVREIKALFKALVIGGVNWRGE